MSLRKFALAALSASAMFGAFALTAAPAQAGGYGYGYGHHHRHHHHYRPYRPYYGGYHVYRPRCYINAWGYKVCRW